MEEEEQALLDRRLARIEKAKETQAKKEDSAAEKGLAAPKVAGAGKSAPSVPSKKAGSKAAPARPSQVCFQCLNPIFEVTSGNSVEHLVLVYALSGFREGILGYDMDFPNSDPSLSAKAAAPRDLFLVDTELWTAIGRLCQRHR